MAFSLLLDALFKTQGQLATVVLNRIKKRAPIPAELVGDLRLHATRKATAIAGFGLPFGNVLAAALDEMPCQFLTQGIARRHAVLQRTEARVEQRQQVVKRGFITGMRR